MDQLRVALAGPHGTVTIVTWVVAGVVAASAVVHAVRRGPRHRRWDRATAITLPLALAAVLVVGSMAPVLRGAAFDTAMALRMVGFWTVVAIAPFAIGQVVELRPPRWLRRTHLGLGAAFLVLLLLTDLVFTRTGAFDPGRQFGPLAVPLLFPVGALAGWWLWSCLQRVQTRSGQWLFALGGSITTLALVAAGLVVEPELADHLLVVGFLPVLLATTVVELQRGWRDRRLRPPSTSPTPSSRVETHTGGLS